MMIKNNVFDVVRSAEEYGLKFSTIPLVFGGKVVEDDLETALVVAQQCALTMRPSTRPTNYKAITLPFALSYTERFRCGDLSAAWDFINLNVGAVRRLAKKAALMLPTNDLEEEDIYSEGLLGAHHAFAKWDPRLGAFTTYAFNWIRHHLQMVAASGGSTFSVRAELHLSLSKAKSAGRDLSNTEAALERVRVVTSLDDITQDSDGKSGRTRGAAVAADGANVEMLVAKAEASSLISRAVRQSLGALSDRERNIIEERYFGSSEVTLESIGQGQGVSRERVRQIEASARAKIRLAVVRNFRGASNVRVALGG
jgi:RNA polymerase sigma-32 factor